MRGGSGAERARGGTRIWRQNRARALRGVASWGRGGALPAAIRGASSRFPRDCTSRSPRPSLGHRSRSRVRPWTRSWLNCPAGRRGMAAAGRGRGWRSPARGGRRRGRSEPRGSTVITASSSARPRRTRSSRSWRRRWSISKVYSCPLRVPEHGLSREAPEASQRAWTVLLGDPAWAGGWSGSNLNPSVSRSVPFHIPLTVS